MPLEEAAGEALTLLDVVGEADRDAGAAQAATKTKAQRPRRMERMAEIILRARPRDLNPR